MLNAAEFRQFLVLCISQVSAVTPLRYVDKYDMYFVSNFRKNIYVYKNYHKAFVMRVLAAPCIRCAKAET